jgi:hypothetical protein
MKYFLIFVSDVNICTFVNGKSNIKRRVIKGHNVYTISVFTFLSPAIIDPYFEEDSR